MPSKTCYNTEVESLENTIRIPLRNRSGKVAAYAVIDAEDYDRVMPPSKNYGERRWYLDSYGYAYSTMTGHPAATTGGNIKLHRLIMNVSAGDGSLIDHINGNKLDNRKANLRLADKTINSLNTPKRPGCSSKYKGVTRFRNKWLAQATVSKKRVYLGVYETETEAYAARKAFDAKREGKIQ